MYDEQYDNLRRPKDVWGFHWTRTQTLCPPPRVSDFTLEDYNPDLVDPVFMMNHADAGNVDVQVGYMEGVLNNCLVVIFAIIPFKNIPENSELCYNYGKSKFQLPKKKKKKKKVRCCFYFCYRASMYFNSCFYR